MNGKLEDFGDIKAEDYTSQERYWEAHAILIRRTTPHEVVCESFRLFGHKAKQQSGSAMETPQLIGYLRMLCWVHDISFMFQAPSDKTRVADPQLVKLGVFEKRGNKHYCMGRPTNLHMRDAIRHGIFYFRYGKGK